MAADEFVLDNNISYKIAIALTALDIPVHHITDILPADTPDEDFFPEIARLGWILITQDKMIRKRKHERLAMGQAGIGVFVYMGRADKSLSEMTRMLLRDVDNMCAHLAKTTPPFVIGISDKGKFERLS